MLNRSLLVFFIISIIFQLAITTGLYFLVYVKPIPELIATGAELLQKLNASSSLPSTGANLVRSFMIDTVQSERATASLLATIATILLACVLVQISVLVTLFRSRAQATKTTRGQV